MICEICKTNEHKYKCSNCLLKYCSLSCYKTHKQTPCVKVVQSNNTISQQSVNNEDYEFVTEDTVLPQQLQKLASSPCLQAMLSNPHLREMLLAVQQSENPNSAMKVAMLEPIFVEFACECLRIVEPCEERDRQLKEIFTSLGLPIEEEV